MSLNLPRHALAVVATAVLVSLTTGCGGGSTKAVCEDALKAFQDYSTQAAAGAGNLEAFNTATAGLAAKLKDLSGKADGDLKATLTDLSTTWGGIKIDVSNPTAATELTKLTTQATDATQRLAKNCS
ncbi:hypothetical protein Skr01_38990 [Sphaerisporangium krabiense]|uniref:Uncharacterized protein n=1 Tax=Sphaerisporangium krabiense TaxID=763782 RepID=A0A7W8Z912_9ACTN|nr:hypothetical protein [Sphaerisporangium krabiense]MBB5629714.1 hypothetical protein [Sphaerisporangium krabiense]GII63814.1 hypothetical protein Skr01_38990 [Sphaerisporangium krabiense]